MINDIFMSTKTQSYKNTEVKGRINERIENVLIESGKLSQSLTKNSRSREVCKVNVATCS